MKFLFKDRNDLYVVGCLQTAFYVDRNDVYVAVCLQTAFYVHKWSLLFLYTQKFIYMLQFACRLRFMYLNETCFFLPKLDRNDVYVAVCLQTAFNVDQNDVYVAVCLQTAFYVDRNDVYVVVCLQTAFIVVNCTLLFLMFRSAGGRHCRRYW